MHQQIKGLVDNSTNILLCLPKNPSTDAIAAGLALFLFLEKQSKHVKIVADEFALPHSHSFLPKSEEIFSDLVALRKFIISLDVKKTQVQELNYDIHDDKLNIYVTPKNGYFAPEDVKAYAGDFSFNLIITLDATDLLSLGNIYEQNVDFFYRTPIINIDHKPANENFGQVNLVEVTATSTSEILFELLQEYSSDNVLDEYIATNLLTGIISKTKSFKSTSVTPRSLAIASHLIASGARRDEIVHNLYQNKSITTLKLWGKTLTKLQRDQRYDIVWSLLTAKDFIDSGATEQEIEKVVDELIINTPEAKNICIIYEKPGTGSKALLATPHYIKAKDLFKEYQPTGSQDFTYLEFPQSSLADAEQIILERLRKTIQ